MDCDKHEYNFKEKGIKYIVIISDYIIVGQTSRKRHNYTHNYMYGHNKKCAHSGDIMDFHNLAFT
jgi:hypothetical protein